MRVQVALVRFSHYTTKEAGKPVSYSQFEVLDTDWDASLGSNDLDMALMAHFWGQFSAKHGLAEDIGQYPKAAAKMRKQVGPLSSAQLEHIASL